MPKELKIALSIWLVVMIPAIFLIAFHRDIAATIWIAIASFIGGIYAGIKDIRSTK